MSPTMSVGTSTGVVAEVRGGRVVNDRSRTRDSISPKPTSGRRVRAASALLTRRVVVRTVARWRTVAAAAYRARGDVFMLCARPGLICSGLRGAMGLGVVRVTVAPFSSPICGTQPGEGCGP